MKQNSIELLSVNVGLPQTLAGRDGPVRTAIVKSPVAGPVAVTAAGLAGDGQADLQNHGGLDMAVYVYPHEHYAYWQAEGVGDGLPMGGFGENLTTRGLDEGSARIGDILRIGDVRLEISQPRKPCHKLELRLKRPGFAKVYLESGRVGFYARVIEGGEIAAGDSIACEHSDPDSMTVRDVAALVNLQPALLPAARRALELPALSAEWRESIAARIERLGSL